LGIREYKVHQEWAALYTDEAGSGTSMLKKEDE
jgi:hypothetical protein